MEIKANYHEGKTHNDVARKNLDHVGNLLFDGGIAFYLGEEITRVNDIWQVDNLCDHTTMVFNGRFIITFLPDGKMAFLFNATDESEKN